MTKVTFGPSAGYPALSLAWCRPPVDYPDLLVLAANGPP
jgi:hypothetical protein